MEILKNNPEVDLFFEEYYRKKPDAYFSEVLLAWQIACGNIPKPSRPYTEEETRHALAVSLRRNDTPPYQYYIPECPKPKTYIVEEANTARDVSKRRNYMPPYEYSLPQHSKQITAQRDAVSEVSAIARREGWTKVCVMGVMNMIDHPQYIGDWAIYPKDQFPHRIPAEGLERLRTIINAGIKIKGVVVMDDPRHHPLPTKLLPPPDPRRRINIPDVELPQIELPEVDWGFVFGTTLKILLGTMAAVAAVVVGAFLIAAILAVGTAMLVLAGVAAALVYDPELAIITSEGSHLISIFSWED
jgi:hypothetical protein